MKNYNLTVVIDKDEDGNFLAICPTLQGCYTEGSTAEEAMDILNNARKLHIEDRLENDEPIYEEIISKKISIAVWVQSSPLFTAKDLIKIIKSKGFVRVRQSGSHAIFKNSSGLRTNVPIHSKKTIGKRFA